MNYLIVPCLCAAMALSLSAKAEMIYEDLFSFSGVAALSNNQRNGPDKYGVMFSVGSTLNDYHHLSLSMGFLYGSHTQNLNWYRRNYTYKNSVSSVPLVAGYTFILPLHENFEFYVGGMAGIVSTYNSVDVYSRRYVERDWEIDSVDPLVGGRAGFNIRLSYRWKFFADYEFWHTWVRTPVEKKLGFTEHSHTPRVIYHVITAGLTFEF